jgi:hypothetical protein
MNTLAIITILLTYAGLGYVLVRNELLLRLHRKQIINLINHHTSLRGRFDFFMKAGGQDMVRDHMVREWARTNLLARVERAPKPPVTLESNFNYDRDVLGLSPEGIAAKRAAEWEVTKERLWPNGGAPELEPFVEDRDTAPALPPFQQAEIPRLPSNNP